MTVGDYNLNSSISSQGGTAYVYNSTNVNGVRVTPTGSFVGQSEVVLGWNPIQDPSDPLTSDNVIIGVDSSQQHTTSNAALGNVFYNGSFSEVTYSGITGIQNGSYSGAATVTTSADAGTISINAPNSVTGGGEMYWDGNEGLYSSTDDVSGGYAIVYGTDIVGAYGGILPSGNGVSGTFAATSD